MQKYGSSTCKSADADTDADAGADADTDWCSYALYDDGVHFRGWGHIFLVSTDTN